MSTVMSPHASRAAISSLYKPNSANISPPYHAPPRPKSGTLLAGQAELGQYLAAMLADQRGRPFDGCGRLAHFDRRPDHPDLAAARMLVTGDHAHVHDLRIFRRAADILHLGAPDVDGQQPCQQILRGELSGLGIDL